MADRSTSVGAESGCALLRSFSAEDEGDDLPGDDTEVCIPDVFFLEEPTMPAAYDRLPGSGERFCIPIDSHKVVVQCEWKPRPRLRVSVDGVVRRETGILTRGLKVQLLDCYDLSCHYQPFLLGGGLSIYVNRKAVAQSFWDPSVLLSKARGPAMALVVLLGSQTLTLLAALDFRSGYWAASAFAVALCLIATAAWEWWPSYGFWAMLVVASLEMVGAGTALATSWALARPLPLWLAWTSLVLFWGKAWLLYLMVRCMP